LLEISHDAHVENVRLREQVDDLYRQLTEISEHNLLLIRDYGGLLHEHLAVLQDQRRMEDVLHQVEDHLASTNN